MLFVTVVFYIGIRFQGLQLCVLFLVQTIKFPSSSNLLKMTVRGDLVLAIVYVL